MNDYQSLSHTKWECKYHVVFIPKYRRKALYGQLRTPLGGSRDINNSRFERFTISKPPALPEVMTIHDAADVVVRYHLHLTGARDRGDVREDFRTRQGRRTGHSRCTDGDVLEILQGLNM